jgi:hypothetical protein
MFCLISTIGILTDTILMLEVHSHLLDAISSPLWSVTSCGIVAFDVLDGSGPKVFVVSDAIHTLPAMCGGVPDRMKGILRDLETMAFSDRLSATSTPAAYAVVLEESTFGFMDIDGSFALDNVKCQPAVSLLCKSLQALTCASILYVYNSTDPRQEKTSLHIHWDTLHTQSELISICRRYACPAASSAGVCTCPLGLLSDADIDAESCWMYHDEWKSRNEVREYVHRIASCIDSGVYGVGRLFRLPYCAKRNTDRTLVPLTVWPFMHSETPPCLTTLALLNPPRLFRMPLQHFRLSTMPDHRLMRGITTPQASGEIECPVSGRVHKSRGVVQIPETRISKDGTEVIIQHFYCFHTQCRTLFPKGKIAL